LVLVFTSIVDTESLNWVATKAVLPSGVNATPNGNKPTAMSVGFLVLVFTSIVDTGLSRWLMTNRVLPSGVNASPSGRMDEDPLAQENVRLRDQLSKD
jgi:hypothetical protein